LKVFGSCDGFPSVAAFPFASSCNVRLEPAYAGGSGAIFVPALEIALRFCVSSAKPLNPCTKNMSLRKPDGQTWFFAQPCGRAMFKKSLS